MVCTFMSGLPQYIRQLLHALSRMNVMTLEQLVTQAWAIMTEEHKEITAQ